MNVSPRQQLLFSRQIMLPEWGERRQARLHAATVFVAGVREVVAVAARYLAGAGLGRLVLPGGSDRRLIDPADRMQLRLKQTDIEIDFVEDVRRFHDFGVLGGEWYDNELFAAGEEQSEAAMSILVGALPHPTHGNPEFDANVVGRSFFDGFTRIPRAIVWLADDGPPWVTIAAAGEPCNAPNPQTAPEVFSGIEWNGTVMHGLTGAFLAHAAVLHVSGLTPIKAGRTLPLLITGDDDDGGR